MPWECARCGLQSPTRPAWHAIKCHGRLEWIGPRGSGPRRSHDLSTPCARCAHPLAWHRPGAPFRCSVGHPSRFASQFAPVNPYACTCRHFCVPKPPTDGPHRRYGPWSVADRLALLQGRADGLTYRELAGRFGGYSVERMWQIVWKCERMRDAGKLAPPAP